MRPDNNRSVKLFSINVVSLFMEELANKRRNAIFLSTFLPSYFL